MRNKHYHHVQDETNPGIVEALYKVDSAWYVFFEFESPIAHTQTPPTHNRKHDKEVYLDLNAGKDGRKEGESTMLFERRVGDKDLHFVLSALRAKDVKDVKEIDKSIECNYVRFDSEIHHISRRAHCSLHLSFFNQIIDMFTPLG